MLQRSQSKSINKQRGFFSVDVMGGIIIFLIIAASASVWMKNSAAEQHGRTAGQSLERLARGEFTDYVHKHEADLRADAAGGKVALRTLNQVRTAGDVTPSLYASQNIAGQSYELRAIVAANNVLQAVVVTTGGDPLPQNLMVAAANTIGTSGGMIVGNGGYCGSQKINVLTLCGTNLLWQMPASAFTGTQPALSDGHLAYALFFDDAIENSDYLYRDRVPGKPELNQMNTYLQMGAGSTATEGQPCYQVAGDASSGMLADGAVGKTSTGLILSCQSGSWKKQSPGSGGYYLRNEDGTSGPSYVNPKTGAYSCPTGFESSLLPVIFYTVHNPYQEEGHYYLYLCL